MNPIYAISTRLIFNITIVCLPNIYIKEIAKLIRISTILKYVFIGNKA